MTNPTEAAPATTGSGATSDATAADDHRWPTTLPASSAQPHIEDEPADDGQRTVPAGAAIDGRAEADVPVVAEKARRARRILAIVRSQALLMILIGLVVFFASKNDAFLKPSSLLAVGGIVAVLGIMATAQTFLVLAGGIDISIGSVAAFTGVMLGLFWREGANVWLAAAGAVGVGLLIGAFNGFVAVRLSVDPLVTSLGSYSIFLGAAFVLSDSSVLVIADEGFAWLGSGEIGPFPVTLVLFAVVFVVGLFIERLTVLGRRIYAIGGNLEAARLSGVRVDLIRFGLYVVSGGSAGLAGVLLVSQLGTSSPNVGDAYLLSVVTAVILGGASLQGGKGTLVGTLVAVAVLGVLQFGFALLRVSSYTQTVVLGALLIGAVLLDKSVQALGRRSGA